ncbi:SDR family NAD(P)-dependent oxidoreductase [Desulfosporosinus lacus]|uniref:Enoyl-(Acyl carrier protein) reductase n=1 Tax=Desulfosporosinus lacus DSM 15449 TaxID=1121420 RepID=A0A1M5UWT9_9FIRM|nr:SDR family oxidoreductase [Desulfosporosinus lacus]SHH67471.1 Enoyl-(Acyl carrier protein) reductase [Desulfosporosinus lacus DSM 15449]
MVKTSTPKFPLGIDLFRLDGRIALITGASGHLGRSMAMALCEAGAHVILNGHTEEKIKLFYEELRSKGLSVSMAINDIEQEADIEELFFRLGKEYDRLDIIVNNAYSGNAGTLDTATYEDFSRAYGITVTASFRILQLAKPLLEKAASENIGGASVINIASMYGVVSPDPVIYGESGANNPPYYGAAKAGLIQLTRYAACHLASKGIRVNSLSPGPFPSPDIAEKIPEFYKELCRKNPMNRIGYADELKGPLLFLASDASSYVTGSNLLVDGGWTAW